MKVEDIPPHLVALLNERAGKEHGATGSVMTTLADILTIYDRDVEERLEDIEEVLKSYTAVLGELTRKYIECADRLGDLEAKVNSSTQ